MKDFHGNHAHGKIMLAGCAALFGGFCIMSLGLSDLPAPGLFWKGGLAMILGVVLLVVSFAAARREFNQRDQQDSH